MNQKKNKENWLQLNGRPLIISGPCSAETEAQVLEAAHALKGSIDYFRAGIWKPRTMPNNFEGVGKEALQWMTRQMPSDDLGV